MPAYRLTRLAREDLQAIRDYIAQDSPATAKRYLGIIEEKCQTLAEYPGLGVQREEYLGLHKFPVGDYLIFYRPTENGIEIIRVLHGARDIERILKN
jgi:toxin ParE1/3/4